MRYSDIRMIEIGKDSITALLRGRDESADKRAFGHALLIAGSKGMMGAAVLAAGAALRSGCGLVTAHIPEDERVIMQVANPAAIVQLDSGAAFSEVPDNLEYYTAVGVGCGIGQSEATLEAFSALLSVLSCPGSLPRTCGTGLVLDADALNMIATHPELAALVPAGSVLTPHTRELSRLVSGLYNVQDMDFSGWQYPWEGPQLDYVLSIADRLSSVVIVKGSRTLVCPPPSMADALEVSICGPGLLYANTTGNAGMAKGGSGDVLTGLITGLRARGYDPLEAAILGVWYHGKAGDDAALVRGKESMNASDIVDNIRLL